MVQIHHLLCHCRRMMKLIPLQQRSISFHLNWHVRAKRLGLLLLHWIVFRYATVIGCIIGVVLKNSFGCDATYIRLFNLLILIHFRNSLHMGT